MEENEPVIEKIEAAEPAAAVEPLAVAPIKAVDELTTSIISKLDELTKKIDGFMEKIENEKISPARLEGSLSTIPGEVKEDVTAAVEPAAAAIEPGSGGKPAAPTRRKFKLFHKSK